ncbi:MULTISPECIES: acyl carrier protein [Kitasatospora]|uniref:acyl carrier protein n=1 Tax=Kitasatospora TaxID=2063 RepID=UPI000C712337|nr:acyl carrier protein [Kitasatospora sp. GP30]MDH6145152.1 acyl carrier protein [Kitasatospora sp. GP30]
MAERQEVLTAISVRLQEVIPALRGNSPDAETDLREYAEFDSLGVLELLVWIEGEFSLTIPDEELTVERFSTPAKIADYIVARG